MNIQEMGGMQSIAQMLMNRGMGEAGSFPPGFSAEGPPTQMRNLTNDQGQSLLDIRGELQGAVKSALQGYDGSGDFRSTIEGAIHSTLTEHGFDPEQVKDAMQDSGFSPLKAMAAGQKNSMMGMFGGGGGFHSAAAFQEDDSAEDLIQSFLERFRAGVNVDFEI